MRKIFLIFLFCFSFLDAYIDECKSDVYFANGIDTDEDTARDSIDEIKRLYRAKHSNSDNTVKDWGIVYNNTHGIGLDLYESMLQKIYEDHPGSSLTPFIWNISEISDYFVLSFKGVVSRVAKKIPKDSVKEYASAAAKTLAKKAVLVYNKKYGKKLTQEEIELMFNEIFDFLIEKSVDAYVTMSAEEILEQERADVSEHLKTYRQSVIDGHGVIVVAHSQGNLFVNRAYNELGASANLNHDKWMRKYIKAIGVASPANNILGEGSPYITFDNDVIQLVPDSLEANLTNPTRYYFTNAVNEEIETFLSVEAHNFLNSYMETNETRNTILSFIDSSVKKHKKADSQWVVDQELNKGTKDYRITVKHRLQSDMNPIMKDVEVYPFNTDKKLYYVDGNISGYVKASCGGTKILDADKDTWDNQQDNEVYYLEGTREVIVGEAFDFLLTVTDRNVYYFPIDYKSGDEIVIASFVKGRYNYCDSIYYRDAFEKFKDVNMVKASEYFKDTNWHGGNFLLPADLFLHRVESKLRYGGMNSKKVSTFKELKEFLLHTMSLESSDFTPTGCYPQKLYVQKY